jgi:hypothetical protein
MLLPGHYYGLFCTQCPMDFGPFSTKESRYECERNHTRDSQHTRYIEWTMDVSHEKPR